MERKRCYVQSLGVLEIEVQAEGSVNGAPVIAALHESVHFRAKLGCFHQHEVHCFKIGGDELGVRVDCGVGLCVSFVGRDMPQ